MKKLIDNFKFTDISLSIILSVIFSIKIYSHLYGISYYSDLNDFYVGTSIYLNYNKHLDLYILFIYLILFFCLLPIIYILRQKFLNHKKNVEKYKKQTKKIESNKYLNRIKSFLSKYQIIGVLGYIFLYPINKGFYPILLIIIIIFIIVSYYDVWKIQTKENNSNFSIFIITAIIFAIFFNTYNITYGPTDDHHFGEKFATFFMHNNFNLEYYKDIMLVHGYLDVIPSWIGCYIFNENNIYGYCLGEILFKNLIFIATIIFGLIIFNKNRLFIAPLLFFNGTNLTVFFITTYLLLIKEKILERPYIWICIYSITSFLFCMTWTTIGSFWIISSLPIFVYQIIQIYTKKDNNKIIKIITALFPLLFLLFFSHSTIIEYLKEAPEYIKGNMYAFGNSFGKLILYMPRLFVYSYKFFALLIVPILLIELIKQINKKESVNSVFFILFGIIFPLISCSYTLGRMDNGQFFRTEYISQAYILVFLPYFLYKFSIKRYNNVLLIIIIISTILYSFINLPYKYKKNLF